MSESAQPRPIVLRRVQLSTAAWQVLCGATSTLLALPVDTSDGAVLDAATTDAAWAELHSLDMSPQPGEVKRQWTGAVALLLTAPLKVTARASYNGVSTTSVLGLRAGRGLAAHQRHVSEREGAQTVITGSEDSEDSMEITLFDEENLWGALARLLPPLDAVRAGAKAAPLNSVPAKVVGAGATAAEAAAVTAGEEANITLGVTAAVPGVPDRLWAGMWSVQQDKLFSVTTGMTDQPEVRLTEVPAGHIANELLFAVVGAHEALGRADVAAGEAGAP